eukprot:jgi/Mesen1/7744/ME000407S06950
MSLTRRSSQASQDLERDMASSGAATSASLSHRASSSSIHIGPLAPALSQEQRQSSWLEAAEGRKSASASTAAAAKRDSAEQAFYAQRGLLFMAFLALQYGLQPIFSRKFVGACRPGIILTSQVIACEVLKITLSVGVMAWEGSLGAHVRGWRVREAVVCSAFPAAVYALQNSLIQIAYRHLDYLTFSMLNQTKLLFTALFNFSFLRIRQSRQQVVALLVMLVAAILLTLGQGQSSSSSSSKKQQQQSSSSEVEAEAALYLGVVPVLAASLLSGLGSTACQWAAQVKKRSPYLMTLEMSLLGVALLSASLGSLPDGAKLRELGFFHAWTPQAAIPVVSNAVGGILVGLVTKYSGGVRKGFVIIAALIVTAMAQLAIDGIVPSAYVWVAMPLVVTSTLVHTSHPYKAPAAASAKDHKAS